MANSIALASKFGPILDEVYKAASLTASMDATTKAVDFGGAASVNVFKTSTVGMGTYSRASGYPIGDVTGTWETLTLGCSRGRSFSIDRMDDEESLGQAFGTLAGEFVRTRVVPEVDAFITEYQRAGDQVEALDQAMRGKFFALGLWLDVEIEANAMALTGRQVEAYARELDGHGIGWQGIYTSRTMWARVFGQRNPFGGKLLWVAHYKDDGEPWLPFGWNRWWLWQWSDRGRLGGYAGNLDMNRFGGTQAEFDAWVRGGGQAVPLPTIEERLTALEARVRKLEGG